MAGLPGIVRVPEQLGTEEGHAATELVRQSDGLSDAREPVACLDFAAGLPITAAELDVIERYFADLIDAALALRP